MVDQAPDDPSDSIAARSIVDAATRREHPRLFVTDERLDRLRTLVHSPGNGHHRRAYEALRDEVDPFLESGPEYDDDDPYALAYLARRTAFCYLLEGDRGYADLAYEAIRTHLEEAVEERQPYRGYGLSRATIGSGFALAYDWCHDVWSQRRRDTVLAVLKTTADRWPTYYHANLATEHAGSNWVAVCFGGELLGHLAAVGDGEYGDRTDRIAFLAEKLARHLETAYGPSGACQEGNGYLEYELAFLLPAVHALRDLGSGALDQATERDWHRLLGAGWSFRADGDVLQWGVGGPTSSEQGVASLLFPLVDDTERPWYRRWYDRHLGVDAAEPSFDGPRRAGRIWSLLYVPETRQAPTSSAAPSPVVDTEKGVHLFRNRLEDADDVLVGLMTSNDHHGNAWSQSETFQLSVLGYGTTFAKGPSKETSADAFSKLLVDSAGADNVSEYEDQGAGRTIHWDRGGDGGGYVVADGSENIGIPVATRELLVDFSERSGEAAVIASRDVLADETAHEYVWQLTPGAEVTAEPTADGRGFLLRDGDAYCAGWVVGADGVDVDDSVQVHAAGSEAELFVVLALGAGTPPEASLDASGVTIGAIDYRPDAPRLNVSRRHRDREWGPPEPVRVPDQRVGDGSVTVDYVDMRAQDGHLVVHDERLWDGQRSESVVGSVELDAAEHEDVSIPLEEAFLANLDRPVDVDVVRTPTVGHVVPGAYGESEHTHENDPSHGHATIHPETFE